MNTTRFLSNPEITAIRGRNDDTLQAENYDSAREIAGFSVPNPDSRGPPNISGWDALDYWGRRLAAEMTNRIHFYKEAYPNYKRLICDARQLAHQSRAGGGYEPAVWDNEPALVYIEYNRTVTGGVNYYFNLLIYNPRTNRTIQIAHISFHSNIPTGRGTGTIIGNFHLKDETNYGRSTPFRRLYIGSLRDRAGPVRRFEIILQKQSYTKISQMAVTFSAVVLQVLQEFFDAGFTAAAMNTPYETCAVPDPRSGVYSIPSPDYVVTPASSVSLPRVAGGKRNKTRRARKTRS